MSKTNFDLWRDGLTAEYFLSRWTSPAKSANKTIIDCTICPADKVCNEIGGFESTCADRFRQWAEQEVEEL